MKSIFGFISLSFIMIFVLGCESKVDILDEKAALFETDRQFAKMSVEKGAAEAFQAYLAEDAMQLPSGENPVYGRDSIYQNMLSMPVGAVLDWIPQDGEVAQSGEMGWTWGNYTLAYKDAQGGEVKSYGKYLNIWEKQENGQWRVLIDMGNKSPKPEEN
jgi:ketosteroid isomerase-like protein